VDTLNFWFEGKAWLRDNLGISSDDLHVHLGLAIFLFFSFALRRHRKNYLFAWLAVFFFQTLNEVMDARDWLMWTGNVNWFETLKDYVNTLFWPTVLCLTFKRLISSGQENIPH
jgi:uncharacterized membrane protein YhaH (DUF805 family)